MFAPKVRSADKKREKVSELTQSDSGKTSLMISRSKSRMKLKPLRVVLSGPMKSSYNVKSMTSAAKLPQSPSTTGTCRSALTTRSSSDSEKRELSP